PSPILGTDPLRETVELAGHEVPPHPELTEPQPGRSSVLAQDRVDDPATAEVESFGTGVVEDFVVRTTSIVQSLSEMGSQSNARSEEMPRARVSTADVSQALCG